MDYKDIRTLKILEEIGNEHTPSQRYLAKSLNVSLGLVNSFIKRLASKGYFKITTIPKNRVKYILTAQGAAEKTRLTHDYVQYSFRFYKESRQKLQEVLNEPVFHNVRKVVFYGMSDFAEIAFISLLETDIQLVAVIDDVKIGEMFFKFTSLSPDQLMSLNFDKVLITDIHHRKKILNNILSRRVPRNKIVFLE